MPLPEGKTPAERAEIKEWLKGRDKYPSGFCNEYGKPGQHEGQHPKDWRGMGMITCMHWLTCPCDCHYQVDQIFELTGMERKLIENPEYQPEKGDWKMPVVVDPVTGMVPSMRDGVDGSPDIEEGVMPPPVASVTPLVERRTPMGYAGRGTLEAQVWSAICAHSEVIEVGVPMTTLIVSEWIAERYKVPTPSRGAIQAVWERWHKMGYAELGKKPVRFVRFIGDGTWEELERIKASLKQQKKAAQAAAKRGMLRPRA